MTSALRKRRASLLVFVSIGALILIGFVAWLSCRSLTPYQVEARFLELLAERDWGGIFDICVEEQFTKSQITRQRFVTLMESASEGLPDAYFEGVTLERMGPKEDDYSRGIHVVFLTFRNGPLVEGAPVEHVLHVKRDREGWKIAINELPIRLVRMHGGDARERWRRLSLVMQNAGISEYWMDVDGPILRQSLIDDYLAGNIEMHEVYKTVPRV
jgi:hypothetical protein